MAGYTQDEINQILNAARLQGYEMTPEEKNAILGNTASYTDYFNPEVSDQILQSYLNEQKGAVSDLQQQLRNAINPQALQQSDAYLQEATNQLKNNSGLFNTVLGSAAGNVRSKIDPEALQQSAQANAAEQLTPEQQQAMVTAAGISAGVKDQAAVSDMERRALASGTAPMGMAAYRARMARQQAADTANAMTQARAAVAGQAASQALAAENQRLGAEQYLTGLQTGTEMQLGQEALEGTQYLGQQALNQYNLQEQNRQQALQYLTNAQLSAAQSGGQAGLENAQNATATQQQNQQFNATLGTQIRQAQDTANSNRTAQVQSTRYNQAANTAAMQSQEAQAVGNARLSQPSTFSKVMGAITAGLGAVAKLSSGQIVTKPTVAVVGEHGPEKIVPIYRARRPRLDSQQQQPKRKGRPLYGEVA
jgi:hypothetical protein